MVVAVDLHVIVLFIIFVFTHNYTIMDNRTKYKITNKVTSLLYNEYKNHETIEEYGNHDDWRMKRAYLKNVAFSLVNYALYGRCRMAPEFFYEYLVQDAKKYQEPQKKFKGILAIAPDNEKDLKDMESVLKEQLEDDKLDAREVINKAIQIIISIGKGDSEL